MKIEYCLPKRMYQCIYLTKDNIGEAMKIINDGIDGQYDLSKDNVIVEKRTNTYIIIKNLCYGTFKLFIYNSWYVVDDDGIWIRYTEKEFEEKYNLFFMKR